MHVCHFSSVVPLGYVALCHRRCHIKVISLNWDVEQTGKRLIIGRESRPGTVQERHISDAALFRFVRCLERWKETDTKSKKKKKKERVSQTSL